MRPEFDVYIFGRRTQSGVKRMPTDRFPHSNECSSRGARHWGFSTSNSTAALALCASARWAGVTKLSQMEWLFILCRFQGFSAALGGLSYPSGLGLKLRQKMQAILLHLSPEALALFLGIRGHLLRPLLRLARYLALLHKRLSLLPRLLDYARRLLFRPRCYLACLLQYLLRLADIVRKRGAQAVDDSEKGRLVHAPGAAKEVPPRLPVQKVLKLRDYLGGLRGRPPFIICIVASGGGAPSPWAERSRPPLRPAQLSPSLYSS